MALSYSAVQGGWSSASTSATSWGVTPVAGDRLLIFVNQDVARTTGTPSGFTHVTGSPNEDSFGPGLLRQYLFEKTAAGSDSAPTLSFGGSCTGNWITVVIQGDDPTILASDAYMDEDFGTTFDGGASLDTTGLTTYSFLLAGHEGGGTTFTPPAGWAEDLDSGSPSFTYAVTMATDTTPGTGTVDPGNFTLASGKLAGGWHLLVRETAVAAGTSAALRRPNRALRMWNRRS